MKTTIITIALSLFCSLVYGQGSGNLTAAQILNSSIRFSGGENRILNVKTTSLTYLLLEPDKSTAISNEKVKTGQKYMQSVLSKTHVAQTTFFNGNALTRVNGSSVIHKDSLDEIEQVKLKTYSQLPYGYKALGYKLTRLPDKKFENFDCYVLNAEAPHGYVIMNFFDKTNYRLLMVAYPNGNKSLLIDYVFKDSVLFNSRIINTFANSNATQELMLQQVALNVDIADLWFNCPYKTDVVIPSHLRTGKFESTNGAKTMFVRDEKSQDYMDEKGNFVLRRFLRWANSDTYGLIDEKAIQNNDTSPESEIFVRIISWDKDRYVCHWIAGNFTDTQDYKLKH